MNTFRLFAGCWTEFWESAWTSLPWQSQDFLCVYVSAEGGAFYTSRHIRPSELWLIHNPVIKALWVRGLSLPVAFDRYASSNCQIFVTATLCVSSPDHGVWCFFHESSAMLSLADDTVDMLRDESSNVVLHLIWTCSFPHCSPVLTETKSATQDYMHIVKAWSQLKHHFPILQSASQHEQPPCC